MGNKVSVIVTCYNYAQFLEEAVASVIGQTYDNWECIIVNDGSTDNTEEVALQIVKGSSKISYYRKENGGLSSARNFGIEKCTGDLILPLDADDKIHKDYIEKAVQEFKKKDVKIVYCEAEYFGAKCGKLVLPEFSREELARMNMIFCTAFFKKSDFEMVGGYNRNMIYGWEDWNLWVAILKNGGEVVKIPEVLFNYRIKEESMLLSLEGARKQKMFMQLYLNHPDFFDQYYYEPIELFDNYRSLKDYSIHLEAQNTLLKGLLTFQPAAFKALARKVVNRVTRKDVR